MSDRLETKLRKLVDLKDAKDRAKTEEKRATRAHAEFEQEVWEDILEQHGKVKTVTIDLGEGYGTIQFQRRETIYGKIFDEEAFLEALEAEGSVEQYFGPKPRKAVLNEEVKDRLERGQALPPGVDFTSQRGITVTRKKG